MSCRQLHFAQRDAGVEGGHDERGAQHVRMDVAEPGPFADRKHTPIGSAVPLEWCTSRRLRVVEGEYGPGFLWIDLPDVFMDFVFEIMDRSALLDHGHLFPDS